MSILRVCVLKYVRPKWQVVLVGADVRGEFESFAALVRHSFSNLALFNMYYLL